MRRRRFLTTVGVGISGLAGCSNYTTSDSRDQENESSTQTPTQTQTSTPTETPTQTPTNTPTQTPTETLKSTETSESQPEITVESGGPDEIGVGSGEPLTLTLRNEGDAPLEDESYSCQYQWVNASRYTGYATFTFDRIPPGETATAEAEHTPLRFVDELNVRVSGLGYTYDIDVVPWHGEWGTFVGGARPGNQIMAESPIITDTYAHNDGYRDAGDGKKWVFLYMSAKRDEEKRERTTRPRVSNMELRGASEVELVEDPSPRPVNLGPQWGTEGRYLKPGERERGWILFKISDSVSKSDLQLRYEGQLDYPPVYYWESQDQ